MHTVEYAKEALHSIRSLRSIHVTPCLLRFNFYVLPLDLKIFCTLLDLQSSACKRKSKKYNIKKILNFKAVPETHQLVTVALALCY